jgi:Flp pilus assembly protein TadD
MRVGVRKGLLVLALGLPWLAGCQTVPHFSSTMTTGDDGRTYALAPDAAPETTGTVPSTETANATAPELLGSDPNDDLSLAKKYFRQGGFGLAERHYRKAVEAHPRDAEAWLGLAAAYDRLRRFDLADRAYRQAIKLAGPQAEILNNQGFSYMLRGDYRRARATLLAARQKDPSSPYIKSNLELLEQSQRDAKAIN